MVLLRRRRGLGIEVQSWLRMYAIVVRSLSVVVEALPVSFISLISRYSTKTDVPSIKSPNSSKRAS